VSAPRVDTGPVPLPTNTRQAWPPKQWQPALEQIAEAGAWYSGDTERLAALYGTTDRRDQRVRFWSRQQQPKVRKRIHVPASADVAMTSADLLFGEEPRLTIPEAHEDTAPDGAIATEDRLHELADLAGMTNTLLEAAEICSGLGGVYLRPWWNTEVAGHPFLSIVHADHAIPEWSGQVLTAVTFWRTLTVEKGTSVWRHLERHEPGRIEHGLYVGDKDLLGARVSLADHPDTADLAANDDGLVAVPDGIRGLTVRYVPNMFPNRKHRNLRAGRADTAGNEDLLDALDETWTSWIRDIRIGQSRIIVPSEFLERRGRGQGASFDLEQEVFSPLEMDPSTLSDGKAITTVNFELRTREHAETAAALFERIVSAAGYSGQTFGLGDGDGGAMTATEIRAREAKTLRTTKRKQRYWGPAVADVVEMMLVIDRQVFGSNVEPMRPRLDFQDGLPDDPRVTAETIELLNRAQAISVETRVRMAQPQLEGEELAAEVARIQAEQGLTVDDPTGGLP